MKIYYNQKVEYHNELTALLEDTGLCESNYFACYLFLIILQLVRNEVCDVRNYEVSDKKIMNIRLRKNSSAHDDRPHR